MTKSIHPNTTNDRMYDCADIAAARREERQEIILMLRRAGLPNVFCEAVRDACEDSAEKEHKGRMQTIKDIFFGVWQND